MTAFTWILTYENFPTMVSDMLLSITQNKILILLLVTYVPGIIMWLPTIFGFV